MLSLAKDHARLEIPANEDFSDVSESIRMLFQLCRVNNLRGALIVSLQGPTDWRSCMRLAIRFCASRGTLPNSKLALVVHGTEPRHRDDVREAARESELICQVFESEPAAVAWLNEAGPGLRVVARD